MERFHIIDIIGLIGAPYPQNGQSSYYIKCPCCDDDPKKRHLNINLKKDVFRCPRCGVSGGLFDLYSLYTGVPRDKAYKAILRQLHPAAGNEYHPPQRTSPAGAMPQATEYPLNDLEIRHATYTAMLGMLSLAPDHRENLLLRFRWRLDYPKIQHIGVGHVSKKKSKNLFEPVRKQLFPPAIG